MKKEILEEVKKEWFEKFMVNQYLTPAGSYVEVNTKEEDELRSLSREQGTILYEMDKEVRFKMINDQLTADVRDLIGFLEIEDEFAVQAITNRMKELEDKDSEDIFVIQEILMNPNYYVIVLSREFNDILSLSNWDKAERYLMLDRMIVRVID